jgi:predicted MarR family transcription regulator
MQRAGQGCAISTTLLERVQLPSIEKGQRTGALRFGDKRAMALVGALCVSLHAVNGFTNRSLRALVAGLLGDPYTTAQMTYDLRRLRLKGLIRRLEHQNRYVVTPEGIKVAVFYTKLHDRLLRPLLAADLPPAPMELRRALRVVERSVDDYVASARIAA